MKLTIRRVYDFGPDAQAIGQTLITPEGWDAARDTVGPFALPDDREAWLRAGATAANAERAAEVVAIARELGASSLCSYGVGTGLLEQQVNRLDPELGLICTDFAPRAVGRLQALFPQATVIRHDLASDAPPEAELHLMHRLDTELDASQWRAVFARHTEPVLFVPSQILSLEKAVGELLRRLRRPRATFAGWFRSEDALRDLWADRFTDTETVVGGLRSFLLRPR